MSHLAPQPQAFEPVELPSKYLKALVAILTAVLAVVVIATQDNVITLVEILNIVAAFLTAVLVYALPNVKDQTVGAWTKAIVAVLGTAVQAAIPLVVDGHISGQSWLLILLQAIGALTVGIVPNANPVVAFQSAPDGTAVVTTLPSTTPAVTAAIEGPSQNLA